MPRKAGVKNAPIGVRRAKAAAYLARPQGVTQLQFIKEHRLSVSTLRKWVAEFKNNHPADDQNDNAIYSNSRVPDRPALMWLRSVINEGGDVPSIQTAHQHLQLLEPEYVSTVPYATARKAAERLVKQALQERDHYHRIIRSTGKDAIPLKLSRNHCNCRAGCGDLCACRLAMRECTDCGCSSGLACGNRAMQLRETPALELRECGERGKGMFAVSTIQKNAFVEEYVGAVITREEREQLKQSGRLAYTMELAGGFFVDAMHHGNRSRFFNHSHTANCRAELWWIRGEPRVGIFAARRITKESEITINYGAEYKLSKCMCSKCGRADKTKTTG